MNTIADIAQGPDFSILFATVGFIDGNLPGSNLAGALSGPGPLTVFAPNNAAFGLLAVDLGFAGDPASTADVISFLTTNVPVATLDAVVKYHVLSGAVTSTDVAAATTLTTLQGGTITPDLPTLVDNEPDLLDPSLVALDIMASNGVVHVIDRVLLPVDLAGNDAKTFTEIVLESGTGFDTNGDDFDMLREAVVAAGLADTLNDPSQDLTVFAPKDSAFVGLSQALGYSGSDEGGALTYILEALNLLSAGNGPALLKTVLQYHVADDSLQSSQVLGGTPIVTLAGATLSVSGTSLVDADPDIANPNLAQTDIQAANGILHVLDGVLIPADVLPSDGSNDVDFLIGDATDEVFVTGADNDLVDANGGNDEVFGEAGNDIALGGAGDDSLFGGSGKDTLKGDEGGDIVFGNSGNDLVDGGADDDAVFGGKGDDTVIGGAGDDLLFGGKGDDNFVFAKGDGNDLIVDFRIGHDKIDLSAFELDGFGAIKDSITDYFFFSTIELEDTNIVLSFVSGDHLDADDFIF